MYLQTLQLQHFKNHTNLSISFHPHWNFILGPNGSGKTNLLESIYFLALTKPRREPIVQFEKDYLAIQATFVANEQVNTLEVFYEKGKKRFLWNKVPIQPLREHIGRIPIVTLFTEDLQWIWGSAQLRRQWLNRLLVQSDGAYLTALRNYHRALKQRNALLKLQRDDEALFSLYEEQMAKQALIIEKARMQLIHHLNPILQHYFEALGWDERLQLRYDPVFTLLDEALKAYKQERKKGFQYGYTTLGPHRNDVLVLFKGQLAKLHASQGQGKSILLALKMAELQWLKQQKGIYPMFLVDDCSATLDHKRVEGFLNQLYLWQSQVFFTDVALPMILETRVYNCVRLE